MASITIRNLDENVKKALKRRAAANNRSMEEEARFLLRAGLICEPSRSPGGLSARIARIWADVPAEYRLDAIIPPRDKTPYEPRVRFDEDDQ